MKLKLTLLSLLVAHIATAQLNYYGNYYAQMNELNFYTNDGSIGAYKPYKENKVNKVYVKRYHKKNKQYITTSEQYFNDYGVNYLNISYNKKGKERYSNNFHMIDSNHFDKQYYIHKGDTTKVYYTFNDDKQALQISYYNKKNKRTYFRVNKFNDKKLQSSISYNKNNKQIQRYEYDYYENGKRKLAKLYNRKDKLKRVWNYACEPAGVLEKKVAQQNICKKRTYNSDSSYLELFENMNEKGQTTRTIIKYSKDSLMLENASFDKNDKEIFRTVRAYNGNRQVAETVQYKKGKLRTTIVYAYTPAGLIESYKLINKKGKEINNYQYAYEYASK